MNDITLPRDVVEQALDALKSSDESGCDEFLSIIDALEERLAQPEQPAQQEPVALVVDGVLVKSELPEKYTGHLYTSPPKRKPLVWLSEEDERQIKDRCTTVACVLRTVKAKLKEKNNDRPIPNRI